MRSIIGINMVNIITILLVVSVLICEGCTDSKHTTKSLTNLKTELDNSVTDEEPFMRSDEEPFMRSKEIQLLLDMDIGPEIVPYLIDKINDESPLVRKDVIDCLAMYPSEASEALPKIIKMLTDDYSIVRWHALIHLDKFGYDARSAIPELIILLDDDDENIRFLAAKNIGWLVVKPDQDIIKALISNLDDEHWSAREGAIDALKYIGVEAKASLPKIKDIAESDKHAYVRVCATSAIPWIDGTYPNEQYSKDILYNPYEYNMNDEDDQK